MQLSIRPLWYVYDLLVHVIMEGSSVRLAHRHRGRDLGSPSSVPSSVSVQTTRSLLPDPDHISHTAVIRPDRRWAVSGTYSQRLTPFHSRARPARSRPPISLFPCGLRRADPAIVALELYVMRISLPRAVDELESHFSWWQAHCWTMQPLVHPPRLRYCQQEALAPLRPSVPLRHGALWRYSMPLLLACARTRCI